jgi:hypothetical protein
MRWLLHGNLTETVSDALRRHGHSVQLIADLPSSPGQLLKLAHEKQLDVLTNDALLVSAAGDRSARFDRSIVFLQLESGDAERVQAIDRLFKRYKRLTPGRIYTVTASRVKVRQLPGISKAQAHVKSTR